MIMYSPNEGLSEMTHSAGLPYPVWQAGPVRRLVQKNPRKEGLCHAHAVSPCKITYKIRQVGRETRKVTANGTSKEKKTEATVLPRSHPRHSSLYSPNAFHVPGTPLINLHNTVMEQINTMISFHSEKIRHSGGTQPC